MKLLTSSLQVSYFSEGCYNYDHILCAHFPFTTYANITLCQGKGKISFRYITLAGDQIFLLSLHFWFSM